MSKRAARSSQDIPSGQNFSPNEIHLPTVLGLVVECQGDLGQLREAIRLRFYADRPIPAAGQGTVWQNVTLGMIAYGLITKGAEFTDVGHQLFDLRDNEPSLYQALARHLLLHVSGVALIECLRDMQRAGEAPSLTSIRKALEDRGIHTSTAGKSISLLRSWLAKAGLFQSQWAPNLTTYFELLGKSEVEIASLGALTEGQRAVLKLLSSLGPGHYDSSQLRKDAEKAYPVTLNEKQFPKEVIYPLSESGFVTYSKKGGRGWTLDVQPTSLLEQDVTIPLLNQLGSLDVALRSLLLMSIADIVERLDSPSRHEKGLALEALGFKLMRVIGLNYVDTRYRPKVGGRFEVDILFDSDRLSYTRWQVQCKNTDRVSLDDIAKEVGLTYYLLSNVIVLITRGLIGEDARRYASNVMQRTNLAIILIDKTDMEQIVSEPLHIFAVLTREAGFALELKPLHATEEKHQPSEIKLESR